MDVKFVYESKDKEMVRLYHPELGSFTLSRKTLSSTNEWVNVTINGRTLHLQALLSKVKEDLPELFL